MKNFNEPQNINELLDLVANNPKLFEEALKNSPASTNNIFSERLFKWFSANSSAETAKHIAAIIHYNDSPLFGAKKKKALLISHILILNSALIINSVNKLCTQDKAKEIIDCFLNLAKKHCFEPVTRINKSFSKDYEKALGYYFEHLRKNNSPLYLSDYFCKKLKLKNEIDAATLYIAADFKRKENEIEGDLLIWSAIYKSMNSSKEGRITLGSSFVIIVNRFEIDKNYPNGSKGLANDINSKGSINNEFLIWESRQEDIVKNVSSTLEAAGLNCDYNDLECVYVHTAAGLPPNKERQWLSYKAISISRCEIWAI